MPRVVFVRVCPQDARTLVVASRGRDFLLEAGSLRAARRLRVRLMPNDGSFQIFTARFRVRNPSSVVNAITHLRAAARIAVVYIPRASISRRKPA